MFRRFFIFVLLFIFAPVSCIYAKSVEKNINDLVISNNYFSFTLPDKTKDTYKVIKENNGIYIYERVSEKSGLGGFAFGLEIFKNPKDYANAPGVRKIGELTDSNNIIYDMVLIQPTEIQYGEEKEIKKKYMRLYNFGENVEIKGINGSKYVKNKGMKGQDLYNEILKKYIKAFNEKWNSDAMYEKAGMGYIYHTLIKSKENLLDVIGYAYYDLNSDGIDELLIGRITKDKRKGIIYDIYTMVDRKPTHVISGGDEDRYFACDNAFLCNENSTGMNKNSLFVTVLESNSTELVPQVEFIYDESKNKNMPWFISYGLSDNSENVSKKDFNQRRAIFTKYKRFNYTPFKDFISE